eukprot:468904-Rhodomonas_salina.1
MCGAGTRYRRKICSTKIACGREMRGTDTAYGREMRGTDIAYGGSLHPCLPARYPGYLPPEIK